MDDLITLCRRYSCLDALNPETKDKREVAEELDKSSSTTYKHLRELAKHNVVKKTNDGYRLTNFGKVMRAKLEDAERAYEAQEVIEALNAPPEILSQGEYVPTQKHVPTGSLEEFTRHLKKAEDMCGLVPVLFPRYLDFHHQQILDGLDAEFVVEREVFEYIREEHGDIVNESLEYGTRLYVTDAELPHGLALIDDTRVGVLVYNDSGHVLGYASFASPRAREHFEEVYEEHREGAERFKS